MMIPATKFIPCTYPSYSSSIVYILSIDLNPSKILFFSEFTWKRVSFVLGIRCYGRERYKSFSICYQYLFDFVYDIFLSSWTLLSSFSSRTILFTQLCFTMHVEWKHIFFAAEWTHPAFVIFFSPFLIASRLSSSKLRDANSWEGMKLGMEKPSMQKTCVCSASRKTVERRLSVETEMLLGLSLGEMEVRSWVT